MYKEGGSGRGGGAPFTTILQLALVSATGLFAPILKHAPRRCNLDESTAEKLVLYCKWRVQIGESFGTLFVIRSSATPNIIQQPVPSGTE